jgi:glycerol-3-phosphate dehydrogenase
MRLPEDRFDAVIVGGGIYGLMLALEGVARSQRVLLIERDDFGGGTTFNHLRTIHGGLRYLQFLDFRRAVISNRQRLWWLRHFPDLVEPISCLMPLYGEGLRRPAAFRMAFLMARALGMHLDGTGSPRRIGTLAGSEVRSLFPLCREHGLVGGALWQDAFMPRPHRIVAELLHWAEQGGAIARNRMEMLGAAREAGDAWRVQICDQLTGDELEVSTRWIINATSMGCDQVIERILGRPSAPLLVPTLAWGLLIDREPVSSCSVAVAAPGRGQRTYFVHPYHGRILAGTGHAGLPGAPPVPLVVPEALVATNIDDLNRAIPGLALRADDVRHVFRGILPGVQPGSEALLMHPRVVDHGQRDAAPGAWTVLGVKFTEAPFVARRLWTRLAGERSDALPPRPPAIPVPTIDAVKRLSDTEVSDALDSIAATEWCHTVEDIACRRSDLWMDRDQLERIRTLSPQLTSTN